MALHDVGPDDRNIARRLSLVLQEVGDDHATGRREGETVTDPKPNQDSSAVESMNAMPKRKRKRTVRWLVILIVIAIIVVIAAVASW
jgi:hypothetical protein